MFAISGVQGLLAWRLMLLLPRCFEALMKHAKTLGTQSTQEGPKKAWILKAGKKLSKKLEQDKHCSMGAHGQVIARSLFRNGVKCQDIEAKTEQAQPGRVAVGVLRLAAFMWTPWLMAGEEESDDDEDAIGRQAASKKRVKHVKRACVTFARSLFPPGEFTLWAAPRWHLLRELFMDEDLNHTALGGWSVGKFQALWPAKL